MTTRVPPCRRLRPLALCLVVAMAGCGAFDTHRESKIPHLGVIDPAAPRELQMVSMPEHVVEPPDELEISVRPIEVDIPLTTAMVRADGNIDLGFYGDCYVAGLTLDEVERKLTERLEPIVRARGLSKPLQVSVRLVNGRDSKRYYVVGTVANENSFPLNGNETVLDGILLAGLRSNSLPDKAYLARPRPDGAGCTILRIDWERIKEGDTTTNYQLFPGDRIVIPGGRAPSLLGSLLGGG